MDSGGRDTMMGGFVYNVTAAVLPFSLPATTTNTLVVVVLSSCTTTIPLLTVLTTC